jgi:hypothetical protein
MSGCECKRDSAQPVMNESGRFSSNWELWPDSSFFAWLPVPPGDKNIESRGKLKMSPQFQKFLGTFKTTREDRTLWLKIQIVSRTLAVPREISNRSGTFEKLHENLNRRLEGERLRRRFELPRENPNLSPDRRKRHRKIEKFRWGIESPAEEKSLARKWQCSAENPDLRQKTQSSAGKSKRQLNFRFSRWKFDGTAGDLKVQARAPAFRNFSGFPAILLNFRLTIRTSSDTPEMPLPTR